ncbi:uncharacterized protein NECHADRAFT_39199 [Fusarium vanettenii 77-13-4]|uniref:FMN hydroxy acid dehydrogenase domain-containing protein n=1 Tax=Fusarium vanettenii (strain ATCC MYA-4622 / CBS 123669 / FGSC 9596 / NRRL 45880 / 77-13-4) TaxID=660122 RepID=C7Z7S1_FUSV7|nr:uncharacterized protein NECHADRAFT_39199 [Fusarium vanettenii 77-13-4]EEU39739.1 hypothetical protein NECHADRAFT_39199 [Fusarium vanettenii 77-13-4]
MRPQLLTAALASGAFAARPFLNEPDIGLEEFLGEIEPGTLPNISAIATLHDFDFAARNYLPQSNYSWFRHGAGGEWSYRNNLEAFQRYTFRQRALTDITKVRNSLPTTILGHNFSAPFYISPAAQGIRCHPEAESGLVKGAAAGDILYIVCLFPLHAVKPLSNHHPALYLDNNDTNTKALLARSEKAGAAAIVFTVDAVADGNRPRRRRFESSFNPDEELSLFNWEYYDKLASLTDLPVVVKGINSVQDTKLAVEHKVPAIIISNHGGRQVDGVSSAIETALEIHNEAPEVFKQTEVWADGGVRYGTDVIKLLALGVKAIGLGRSFMYSNVYGAEGVERAIDILKYEIAIDAANLGISDLKKINPDWVRWNQSGWYS